MGLNRCTVCKAATPEPDTAFCSNLCCEAWTRNALVDLEEIRRQVVLEAELSHAAMMVTLEAQRTGLWN